MRKNAKFNIPLDNLDKARFHGVGNYDIPMIQPKTADYDLNTKWIPWNYVSSFKDNPAHYGVHFFIHDYQFTRLWAQPDTYIERLRKFKYVLSPEFSIYTNMPPAMQIYNHYRKHWLGAYLQLKGVNVIPTITWGLPQSFNFVFDGEPSGTVVAVSGVGCTGNGDEMDLFMMGYEAMKERLNPSVILFNGKIPEEIADEVTPMERGYKLFAGKTPKSKEAQ